MRSVPGISRRLSTLVGVAAALVFAHSPAVASSASAGSGTARVGRAVRHGLSARLLREAGRAPRPTTTAAAPPATRSKTTRRASAGSAPGEILNFDGASFNDNLPFFDDVSPPPDANGAVGPSHYFQAINLVFRIYDKSGNLVLGPVPTDSLWAGLGGPCETGDVKTPLVRYDFLSDRWLVSQAGFDPTDGSTHECIAVSTSGDPTAQYFLYDFPLDPSSIATSVRIGIWPDAYFLTVNQFNGLADAGFGVYAFDRLALLNGSPTPTAVYENAGADFPNTLWALPSDLEPALTPAVGAPNAVVVLGAPAVDGSPNAVLHVWSFHPDFESPLSSTFTGPVDVAIDEFSALECGSPTEGCVPQLDTTQLLQAHPNRLMSRLAFRHFLDHDTALMAFTVDIGGGVAGVRWLELRDPTGQPLVFQQSTYAPDQSYRFVPSIAIDQSGDVALGYSKSDATIHPSLAYTGRLAGDPLGELEDENVFFAGPNSQPPVVGSWGAYSSMMVDPVDQCTFWFTSEYIGEPAPYFEYTRIASFKFPGCGEDFSGSLVGTVTVADTGQPIPGASVSVGLVETETDGNGFYQFLSLPLGSYDMTVTKFGYLPGTAAGVSVFPQETTTQDFSLASAPLVLLNGVVRDGSGAGWPLYARLRVSAPAFGSTTLFTDPVTGYYGIALVAGVTYTLSTEAITPGYLPDERSFLLDGSMPSRPEGVVQNVALTVDATPCSAPGYALVVDGLSESFDAGGLPPFWSVVNDGGGAGWAIHEGGAPCGLFGGNLTGGSGPYALVDSGCDGEVNEDSGLVTPPVDATALSSVQIRFHQDFNGGGTAFGEIADVDVSTDGGSSWTNTLHQTTGIAGPNTQSIDVTGLAAGQPDVRARFHYYNGFAALWWQVDDVILGETHCSALPGGLVVGNVLDANTGLGLNGASVANAPGGLIATSVATPDDPAVPDGFYAVFSESGPQVITAWMTLYSSDSESLTVVPNSTQRLDFHLTAGSLTASPTPISVRVNPGEIVGQTLVMTNSGALPASFDLAELNVPPVPASPARPRGPFADPARVAALRASLPSGVSADGRSARGLAPLPGMPQAAPLSAGNVLAAYPTNLTSGWGIAFNTDATDFWVSNSARFAGDNLDYRYRTDGTQTGDTIDDNAWVADYAGDGAYNPRTETLWRVNVGGDDCIYELDPNTRAATGNRLCPAFGTSQRGLAYDPVSDTYYSGSWTDGVINHFDAAGTLIDSAYVGVSISGLAFNPSNGRLYGLTNHDVLLGFDVYVFDTRNHYAVIGAFFITSGGSPVLSTFGGAGMEMDCAGHLWLVDEGTQTIYEAETEEADVCAWKDIPWLTESPSGGTVPPGSTLPITCTFDPTNLSPGLHQGELRVHTNTPYRVAPVPVDMTVRFLDVDDGSLYQGFIYGVAGAGVMPGCDAAGYVFCPTDEVTRADMAGFILRAVHGASFVPAPYAGAFGDVHAGDDNADYIQSFFDEGYTAGCGGGNFCPGAVHTRGQTAVFILRGVHGPGYVPPPCASTHEFDDESCPPTPGSPFGDWIGELSVEGITAGCGGNDFCPNAGIPNQQMATFLVKAFSIPHL